MDFQSKTLASGKDWCVEWSRIQGKESVLLRFDNDTVIDQTVLNAVREHKAWHLYCGQLWNGSDLSVFAPVADIVEKLALPAEKTTKVRGVECFANLKELSVSGDLSELDFRKLTKLRSLHVNESKGGNWHLCDSLDFLMVNVAITNLKKLKALKNLRSLSCGRGLKSLEGIGELLALRELRMGPCHLDSLESLGRPANLRLLMVNLFPKLQSLKGVEALAGLEELDVSQCGELRDVSAISALKKLKKLTVNWCPHIKSLDGVKLPAGCAIDFTAGKVGEGF